ncbi:MAG: 1,4-dihydroxy-2-naphthoate polyprenyltransferase [Frankiales bacterium]|nr:1,4-dihydroxy-2-naphthoate polyprenyltransferase [Frankiales bacterium]
MASVGQWVQGARPRTLPAAVAPVLLGTAAGWYVLHAVLVLSGLDGEPLAAQLRTLPAAEAAAVAALSPDAATSYAQFVGRALLALVVSLALQVGVNYANDYSDGVRGTDDARVGPVRLVGQGLAPASHVRLAALLSFAVAAAAGLALVLLTHAWWLVLVGLAAILAAWFYTGGPRPYGYAGFGELFVFVFFGLVAVVGTTYVLTLTVEAVAVGCGVAAGSLSVAILLANNLRDIPTDAQAGKRTLAVRIGDRGTRIAYSLAVAVPFLVAVSLAIVGVPWALLSLVAAPLAVAPAQVVRSGAVGRELVPVLAGTGLLLLGFAVALSAGLVVQAALA